MNETIRRFGHPDTLLADYEHWVVLLRPAQATLGALILAAKADVTRFSALPAAAFAEQGRVIADIEAVLEESFGYDKLNYLMLMMVDPHVHYHVLPRYETPQETEGTVFEDPGWPGPPVIGHDNAMADPARDALTARLRAAFEAR